MIKWNSFAVRVLIGDLEPRHVGEWASWRGANERVVSFRSKNRWRQAMRATGRLDSAHKQARALFATAWTPSPAVHGFVKGKNTTSAATMHVGASAILVVDLADFFGQVTYARVASSLGARFDDHVCSWIEGACFRDGALPLGFRTSPALSNLAFHDTDSDLERVAATHSVSYSRWVDDLTFSGPGVSDELLRDVRKVLDNNGWAVNDRKIRFMRRSPYVLGLYVGSDVNSPRLPRWLRKKLLVETYHFSRLGYQHFSHEGVMSPPRLFGRVAYANVVDPKLAKLLDKRLEMGHRIG